MTLIKSLNMKAQSFNCSLGSKKASVSHSVLIVKSLALLFVLNLFSSSAVAQNLDPTVPPSENFDLSYWKLTRSNGTERDEDALANGFEDGEFYTDTITGAMVFTCPNRGGTTANTSFSRTELREMIRRGNTSISTQGINKNNWVFSSSTMANQEAAGGVDGIMTATLTVDHVSETSDEFRKIGRTIVGQIHASDDEPVRLYYRKLPGHERGSIYFAHEPTTSAEQWYDMIGSRSDSQPDPADGIALGEKFSYEIKVIGHLLTVTIMREGKPDVVTEVDMTDSGFADDWMYFRAGNYNQNNAGDDGEFAKVSFYALDVEHFSPTPPTAYDAPSDIPRFQPFLSACKLQAPTSSTLADVDRLNDRYTHPQYFYVVDGDKIRFNQSGDSQRTELRHETNWDLNQANRSLHGRIDIVEQTCDQVTVMQIHDDANAGNGPNKPLLRIYKHNAKAPINHLWAAIKTDDGGVATTHVDLGEDPGGYFNCDIRLVDGRMIIDFEGEEKVNMDVSFWSFPSYWKAGVYLQDSGEATAHFDELFEEDGSPQNYVPTVSILNPINNDNYLPGSDITIEVDAVDSDGSVTRVEFFEGGTNKLGEDTTAPYSFTWTDVAEGEYTLTARATDNEGASKTTLSTKITVRIPIDITAVELVDINGPIADLATDIQLQALITPSDATNQNLVFESDDPSVATITNDGILNAVSEGTVNITVTTQDGGFSDTKAIKVLAPSADTNWSIGGLVEGTGIPDGSNDAFNLIDEDPISRWSVNGFPQSATIDLLGDDIKITQTEVICHEDRAYQFILEVAADKDGPYTTIVDRSTNFIPGTANAPIVNDIDSVGARYVRITVTDADVYTGDWVSITELRVFGEGERIYSSVNENDFEQVLVYPNPASSILNVEGGEDYDNISIYDVSGRLMLHTKMNASTIDISDLETGIYYLRLEGQDQAHISKLIKL